jgi:non-specific serine/threonine protein kinase
MGLQLVGALWWFWKHLGLYSEGRKWFDKVATLTWSSAQTDERALAFYTAAFLARAQGDYAAARSWNEESVAIWRDLEAGEGLGHSLAHLGRVALAQGDLEAARKHLEETIAIFQERDDKYGLGKSLTWLGSVASAEGDDVSAFSYYQEGAAMFREVGEKAWLSVPVSYLGYVACRQGDYATARSFFDESFTIWREVQDPWSIGWGLEGLAGLAGAQGRQEQAARLFGAAEALLEISGVRLDACDRVDYDRNVAAVRARLGEAAFATAWTEGQAMTIEQAIEYALAATLGKSGVAEGRSAERLSKARTGSLGTGDS